MESKRNRLTKRMAVHWPTMLLERDRRQSCTIVEVSRRGARIMLTRPVTPKSCVTLIDDRVGALEASIVWCRGSLAGVAFLPETAPEVVQKLRAVLAALEEAEARRMPQGPQPPDSAGARIAGRRRIRVHGDARVRDQRRAKP